MFSPSGLELTKRSGAQSTLGVIYYIKSRKRPPRSAQIEKEEVNAEGDMQIPSVGADDNRSDKKSTLANDGGSSREPPSPLKGQK